MKQTKPNSIIALIIILIVLNTPISVAEEANPLTYTEPKAVQAKSLDSTNGNIGNNLFTGAATYSYPIRVPPGINGFQPDISINYNHQSNNREELGLGWALSKSYIYRDTKSTRSDITDDIFYLNMGGASMKLVYVASENMYHTEYESYMRIRFIQNIWEVTTKEGIIYTFGETYDSRQDSILESYTSIWYLNKVKDPHKNQISYIYIKNPNTDYAIYLSEINYNKNSIVFNYDYNKHIATNGYYYGTTIKQSAQLNNIEVKNNNQLVRKYKSYYDLTDEVIMLSSIKEYGSDGASELNHVDFDYFENSPGWTLNDNWKIPSNAYFGDLNDMGVRIVDINGDGLNDLVKSTPTEKKVWYNNGNGFNTDKYPAGLNINFVDSNYRDVGTKFAEINGDGKTDIIQALSGVSTAHTINLNQGNQFSTSAYPSTINEVNFIELSTYQECTPPSCSLGGNQGVKCNNYYCERTCKGLFDLCDSNWVKVFEDSGSGYNTGNSEEYDYTDYYTSSSNSKCYKYVVDTPNNVDMQVDEDECYNGDEDTDGDTIMYATIETYQPSEDSWLSTVPAISSTNRWYGELDYPFDGADFQYAYLFSHEYSGDDFTSDDITDFAYDDKTIYCTPDSDICDTSFFDGPCGYGCVGQKTKAKVKSGYYEDIGTYLESVAYDNECDDSETYTNKAQYIKMTVYSANLVEANSYKTYCNVPVHMEDQGYRIADVNGDGRSDIVKGAPSPKTLINTKNGWVWDYSWYLPDGFYFDGTKGADEGQRIINVNGDNLPDLVWCGNYVSNAWLNTGKGWTKNDVWKIPLDACFVNYGKHEGIELVDLNGDGFVDILKKNKDQEKVWMNNGNGWNDASFTWDIPSDVQFNISSTIVDINGDGMPDIVKAISSSNDDRKTWINNYGKQNLLNKITNSMGGTTAIDYKKISEIDNYDMDSVSDLSFNGWVVKSITEDNGMSGLHHVATTTEYNYLYGKYDAENKEFMGFSYVQEIKPGYSSTEHSFYQDKAKKGMEYETTISSLPLSMYKMFSMSYSSNFVNNYYITKLDSVIESTFDGELSTSDIVKTDYSYDDYGNIAETNYLGWTSVDGDEKTRTVSYEYNFIDWILNKPTTNQLFDAEGKLIRSSLYTYNQQGDVTTEIHSLFGDGENPMVSLDDDSVVEYEYNSFGNMISKTSPNKHITKYEYDPTHTFMTKEINALGHESSYVYDQKTGNVLSTTDHNEYTTSYEYDIFGRKTKEILPYDSSASPTVEYVYQFDGAAPELVITKHKEDSSGNLLFSYKYYDGMSRLVEEKTESEPQEWVTAENVYDEYGRLKEVLAPHYTSSNTYTYSTGAYKKTSYTYDVLDRITQVKFPDNSEINIDYNQWKTSTYNQLNVKKDYTKDAYSNIVQVDEYNNNQKYTTEYEYDPAGDLKKITDSQSNDIIYTYDSLGRKTESDDPDMGKWTYNYDAEGNLISQESSNGDIITLVYDELSRVISKSASNSETKYTYDAGTIGTLSSVESPILKKNFEYDERLRVTNQEKIIDDISFKTSYEYDSTDRITSKTLPSNEVVEYEYNSQGMLSAIPDILDNIQYDIYGAVTEKEYTNSLSSHITYDTDNHRLASISTGAVQDLKYGYDANGNIININDVKNEATHKMKYDDLDRLTHAMRTSNSDEESDAEYDITYSYDNIGNMLNVQLKGIFEGDIAFNYGIKPIHAPSSIAITGMVAQNVCEETQFPEKFCKESGVYQNYQKADCNVIEQLVEKCEFGCENNKCILKGCAYNNPVCNSNEECVNNKCELKKGCSFNNPACNSNEECVNNVCVLKNGCTFNNPACNANEECGNNKCELKKGCSFNNPACNSNEECVNNVCVLKKGCSFNNPACNSNEECVNNVCVLKNGCSFNNPACNDNEECTNNVCVLKNGCSFNNPVCNSNEECVNNKCELKKGCSYNNPTCNSNEECVNNVCVLKNGCSFNNPACNSNEECVNNKCELKKGCSYNNPSCNFNEECVNNQCIAKQLPDLAATSIKLGQLKGIGNDQCKAVFEFVVENKGSADAKDVKWKAETDKGEYLTGNNKPIKTINAGIDISIYPQFIFGGKITPLFFVDKENTILELNENNNVQLYNEIECVAGVGSAGGENTPNRAQKQASRITTMIEEQRKMLPAYDETKTSKIAKKVSRRETAKE